MSKFFSHISLLLLSFDISIKEKKEGTLNKDAKGFIPTKNRKLKLNENAKEYIYQKRKEKIKIVNVAMDSFIKVLENLVKI